MLTTGRTRTNGSAEAEAPDPAIFDREHLRQYTSGEEVLERELIGLFLGQLAPIRAQLDATASPQDWKFASHSLKGAARSIGAPQIAALAERLDSLGPDEAAEARSEALAQLDEAMAAFAAEVEKLLVVHDHSGPSA